MAKFLRRRRSQKHRGTHGHQLRHDSHRGALCQVRRPLGARVSGWSGADGIALLHELSVARLQAEAVRELQKKKTMECRASCPAGRAKNARASIAVLEFRLRILTSSGL